jgi:hypothetical protein
LGACDCADVIAILQLGLIVVRVGDDRRIGQCVVRGRIRKRIQIADDGGAPGQVVVRQILRRRCARRVVFRVASDGLARVVFVRRIPARRAR